ncbi:MAG: hypothetical protein MMC23_005950 [Stictis urceolatum]|nr:hypothetical protein [Stictis urceolata]
MIQALRPSAVVLRLTQASRTFATSKRREQALAPLTKDQVRELISKPSWSVKSLHREKSDGVSGAKITQGQLHHLLRLSALPLPASSDEEVQMIETLESQLHFVRAIQTVDTTGVEPLQSIRDETSHAEDENEINLETLEEELGKEKIVGFARRIIKDDTTIDSSNVETGDPLGQAPKKLGRFIVVNTRTS